MNHAHPFFPRHAFRFKGGGGSTAPTVIAAPVVTPPPAVATVDTAPAPVATPPPTIMAPTAPAATVASPTVTQAQIDARKASARRRGIGSTLLAGVPSPQSDGGTLGGGAGGKNTLLGGG